MSTYSANDIPGNRLELAKKMTVFEGEPNSNRTTTWEAGFVTPPVYSYVQRNGDVFWQIGEIPPIRFIKHDPNNLDVVPDSGGAKFINPPPSSTATELSVGFDALGNFLSVKNLKNVAKIGLAVVALVIGLNIYGTLSN